MGFIPDEDYPLEPTCDEELGRILRCLKAGAAPAAGEDLVRFLDLQLKIVQTLHTWEEGRSQFAVLCQVFSLVARDFPEVLDGQEAALIHRLDQLESAYRGLTRQVSRHRFHDLKEDLENRNHYPLENVSWDLSLDWPSLPDFPGLPYEVQELPVAMGEHLEEAVLKRLVTWPMLGRRDTLARFARALQNDVDAADKLPRHRREDWRGIVEGEFSFLGWLQPNPIGRIVVDGYIASTEIFWEAPAYCFTMKQLLRWRLGEIGVGELPANPLTATPYLVQGSYEVDKNGRRLERLSLGGDAKDLPVVAWAMDFSNIFKREHSGPLYYLETTRPVKADP